MNGLADRVEHRPAFVAKAAATPALTAADTLASGAADPGQAMANALLAIFGRAMAAGGSPAGAAAADRLILASLGQPLPAGDLADPSVLATLVDQIPLPGRTFQAGRTTCSGVYGRMLDLAKLGRREIMAHRNQALAAKAVIFDYRRPGQFTSEYLRYLDGQAAYEAARYNAATAAAAKGGRPAPPDQDPQVQTALRSWRETGFKDRIDPALKALDQYYQEDVAAWFADLHTRYNGSQTLDGRGQPWLPVLLTPPADQWPAQAGWQPWRYQVAERPSGSGPAPAWTASAGLTVEVKRVTVERPWLDWGLFTARNWRLEPGGGLTLVSAGDPDAADPGAMPLVVTGLLLARRLRITGAWAGDPAAAQVTRKAFGPFTLAGAVADRSAGQFAIRADGLQIIGYFCRVLPRCPNPDPALFPHPPR
jgi:hypothetical protein